MPSCQTVSGWLSNRIAAGLLFAAGAAAILVYFISFAGGALHVGYSHDDLMNMDRALDGPFGQKLVRSLLFFLPALRPLGDGLYQIIYQISGFDPLLLRATCFALALVNVAILCVLMVKVSSSYEIGLIAALLGAIHGNLSPLYFNSGSCYDLLAFPLYCLALWMYVRERQRGRVPGAQSSAAILVLFVLALSAKEIALSFPLVVLAYELIWHPPASMRHAAGWILRECRTAWLSAAIAAIFVAVRVYGTEGVTGIGAPYQPVYSVGAYLNVLTLCMNDLFYRTDTFTPLLTAVLWGALIAIAALLRSRFLIFCVSFTLLGMLPLAFVTPRGLSAAYLPIAGLWGYFAALLVQLRRYAAAEYIRQHPAATFMRSHTAELLTRLALFAAVLVLLVAVLQDNFAVDSNWIVDEAAYIRTVSRNIQDLRLNLPRTAKLLLVNDAFEPRFPYATFFLLRLIYHDHSIEVARCSDPTLADHYDAVLSYQNGRFERLTRCSGQDCCH
jgi:hypothetical protein